jgi:FtsP/CotA-like multicopper oxidase with cupredoxin domain
MSRPVRRALVLLVCGLAPAQPGAVHAPRAGARSPECAEARFVPGEPAADLYCIALLPTDAAPAASGTAELRWVPTPFGTAVTRDGEHVHRVRVTARGLPEPSSLGPYTTYIAWATTPVLDPVVKLGVVDGEAGAEGLVAFNKFLVLVTAEASPDVEERAGRLVLRGQSASMLMQPHDLPFLLAAAAAGGDSAAAAHGHGGGAHAHGEAKAAGALGDGWIVPPMHPKVSMPEALMRFRPAVAPFLPSADPAALADAVPRQLVRLRDGDTLRLEAGLVRRRIRGRTLVMYGFNGQYPGPLIHVDQGTSIVVEFTNRLDMPTAVHWHGIRLDNRYDGVPHVTQDPVPPGGSFTYVVRFPDAGIYWYHPHHREDIQQDLGLYGNLLVRSPRPDYYGPAHREEVLMLDDLLLADEGLVPYGREHATDALMGRFGNLLLVNGEPRYELSVRRGEVVRFFLTNVANTRTFNVSFTGARMKVVASDVSRFEREEWVESVVIAPAERYVVDVRFETPGTSALENRIQSIDHLFGYFFPEVDTLGLVRVAEEPAVPDHGAAFSRLRAYREVSAEIEPYRRYFDAPVEKDLVLTLELGELPFPMGMLVRMDSLYFNPVEWSGTMPEMNWIATSREVKWVLRDPATGRENMDIAWRFRVGDVVKLRLTNNRFAAHAMQHPIHIHGQRFLVLSVNGVPNENLVWKDTVLLPVGATAELLLELTNPGRWMLHCHVAEHLEAGMMMVFEVVPDDAGR